MAFKRAVDTIEDDTKPRTKFVRNFDWFKLEENKQGIYRFVTEGDEIISVKTHQSIPTKDKPSGYTGKWPSSLPGVCRYDSAFLGIHSECYVCDEKVPSPWTGKPITSSARYWALAVEREEIRDKGVLKGYRDVMVEREEDGKTIRMPKVVVFNLGAKNFFSALLAVFGMSGSITDQDYKIMRVGSGTATNYVLHGLGSDRDKSGVAFSKYGTPEWWDEHYGKPIEQLQVNLEDIVAEQASDERYARFFDPGKSTAVSEVDDASESPFVAGDQGEVDPTDLAAMRARVRKYSPASA